MPYLRKSVADFPLAFSSVKFWFELHVLGGEMNFGSCFERDWNWNGGETEQIRGNNSGGKVVKWVLRCLVNSTNLE